MTVRPARRGSATSRTSRSPGSCSRTSRRCCSTRRRCDAAVRELADWARPREVDFVVAAEARGFILGAALARELGAGFVPARKPGKLPQRHDRRPSTSSSTASTRWRCTPTRSPTARACCCTTTCWPRAAPRARWPSWSRSTGAEVVGCAFLVELAFLGGRERLGASTCTRSSPTTASDRPRARAPCRPPPEAVWARRRRPATAAALVAAHASASRASATRLDAVLRSDRGRVVRADWRARGRRAAAPARWSQELEGTPFEKLLARAPGRGARSSRPRRHRGDARAAPALARLGALRRPACCAARPRASSTARSRGSPRRSRREARAGLLGLGRARRRARAARARRGVAARRARRRRARSSSRPVRARGRAPARAGARRRGAAAARGVVGADGVRTDREARVLRCRGKSYLDLLAQRAGDCETAPDAVVAPGDARPGARRAAGVRRGRRRGRPVRRRHERRRRPRARRAGASTRSSRSTSGAWTACSPSTSARCTARARSPGCGCPEADRALAAHGLHARARARRATSGRRSAAASRRARPARPRPATAGSTRTCVGAALRDARRASSRTLRRCPRSAAGPALRAAARRLRGRARRDHRGRAARAPGRRRRTRYEGWFARSLRRGRARRCASSCRPALAPDIARLSDEDETRMSLALAGAGGLAGRAGLRAARARLRRGCLLDAAAGRATPTRSRRRRAPAARVLRAGGRVHGGAAAGARRGSPRASPGRTCATTCSTAACSSRRSRPRRRGEAGSAARRGPRRAARRARRAARGLPRLAPLRRPAPRSTSPCSRARDRRSGAAQWRRAKAAATDAIVGAGGTITHHHAVGRDHAPWLEAEDGRARRRGPARGQGALRPGRDHEPGRAAGERGSVNVNPGWVGRWRVV